MRVKSPEYFDKKMLLWKLAAKADNRIEPTLIDAEDFKTCGTQMAFETKKTGMKVV